MLPEQQRVLGYFIEEAKDNLNTIEQGLLNLQNTLKDTEMVNQVFRAAHSIKGGAAMLELDGILQTAHYLEYYFKVLKECPQIQVDQKLELLFLRVFNTLKKLLKQLEDSFSLPEDVVNNIMLEVEPVFEVLNQHLELLVQSGSGVLSEDSLLLVSSETSNQSLAFNDTFDWEDTSDQDTQAEEKLLPTAQEAIESNLNIDTEIKVRAAEVGDMHKAQITGDADDLNDLFTTGLDEQPLLETDTNQIKFENLEVVNAPQAPGENSFDGKDSVSSFNETLAFDDLFGVETPLLLVTEESEFCNLFDQPKESQDQILLEELTPTSAIEDIDSENESVTPPQMEFELEESWFSLDSGDRLVDVPPKETFTPSLIKSEATAATELDSIDNLNTAGELSSTFDDFWDEQPELLTALDSSLSIDLSEAGEKNAPTLKDESVLPEVDGSVTAANLQRRLDNNDLIDTTETDLFTSLGEKSNQYLNFLLDDPADQVGIETLSDINIDFSSAEVVDDEFDALEALLADETTSTDDFFELDALLDLEPPTLYAVTQQDLSEDVLSAETTDDEFGDLEALLGETTANTAPQSVDTDEFSELDSLLDLDTLTIAPVIQTSTAQSLSADSKQDADDFSDLENLLEQADKTTSSPPVKSKQADAAKPRRATLEQMMKIPIKQLDNVSNLVGELVVNRNSLEQDQQRLRQSLDNLLHQVQQLNGVGSRMQELYERSLMEASLINIRQGSRATPDKLATSSAHSTGMDFDALEMDRFTGFHTLSQEMIELIVRVREASSDIEFVTDDTEQVARQFRQVTTQLQEGLTRSRMVPFSEIADRLPRAVRDISLKYGKQVELHIEGRETLIDKMLLQQLYDPMTHLVNNSITHGIETPEKRTATGKSSGGKVTIRAFYQGNQTVIAVNDDGAGIDTDVVMTKAIQKGLITVAEARKMSPQDAYTLLFHPGFSTKDQADEYAGRGVGMDVVQTSLNEIRGTISTDSTLGKGTTFTIRLPLTLSICKALCCLSDKAQIAFPMDGVEDTLDISPSNVIANQEGQSCISWRDSLLPFRPLKELLACNRRIGRGNLYGGSREDDLMSIVVLRSADTLIAVQVDQVLGEQEIVIKQLEGPAPKPVGITGATVMGDGRIMPIADVLELIDLSMGRLQRQGGASLWTSTVAPVLLETPDHQTEPMVLIVDDSITVRELLSMTFDKAGYRVEQARDGQEAWDKLRDGLPCDLIFCDIEMPRMDGLELLSRMQKDPHLSQLPIAMLTSRGADRHRQMAVQLGARGYFTKPYVEEALLDGAQRMLNGEVLVAVKSLA